MAQSNLWMKHFSALRIQALQNNTILQMLDNHLPELRSRFPLGLTTLSEMLNALHHYEPFFRLQTNIPQDADNLLDWFNTRLGEALNAQAAEQGAPLKHVTPEWHKILNASLFTSIVAIRLVFQKVPNISFDQLYFLPNQKGTINPVYTSAHSFYGTTDDTSADIDVHLIALIKRLGMEMFQYLRHFGLPERLFWGNLFYSMGLSITKLSTTPLIQNKETPQISTLIEWYNSICDRVYYDGKPLNILIYDQQVNEAEVYIRRETCCLRYLAGHKDKCGTCMFIKLEDQLKNWSLPPASNLSI